jgi:hypothetical protein
MPVQRLTTAAMLSSVTAWFTRAPPVVGFANCFSSCGMVA